MNQLSKEITKSIKKVDPDIKEFAISVAHVLKESYGDHNYKAFLKELKNNLK